MEACYSRLDLEHRTHAGSLHFREENLPHVSRQHSVFTCLQRDKRICQHVGPRGQMVGGEQDAVIADLGSWNNHNPSHLQRVVIIELDFCLRTGRINSLLAGF